ncbi:MAG: hypothetical protein DMG72_05105 [Acidobacteria bacterium]|nr:MAG: hypothetical protein DMG72_05105 [Acidobacteriota bacterium]
MPPQSWTHEALWSTVAVAVRPLHGLIAAPCLLFLATLTLMLFRPPDLQFYAADRIAFLLLVMIVLLRASILRQPLWITGSVSLPMIGLLLLACSGVLTQPFEAVTYSLLAAKFVVPFTLFHLSMLVFSSSASLRRFETFSLLALTYLSFTAIAFLVGAKALIFPAFILDESLGIHADRARGPFLQAVANGVTLNMLGLIALDAFRRGRLRGIWAIALLGALPLAILATMTRAVWLSFSISVLVLLVRTSSRRLRRACLCLVVAGAIGVAAALSTTELRMCLQDRLVERGPVEVRLAELANRVTQYQLNASPVHNTYLEILVEHGIIGLALYLWLIIGLFRLGHAQLMPENPATVYFPDTDFTDDGFRKIWPILLGVYLMNASFVVMNYQFVNGLLFTLAGILAAQNRRAFESQEDVLAS